MSTAPILVPFLYFSGKDRAFAAWLFTITITASTQAHLPWRKHAWFWVAVLALVAVHIPLLILVPWPSLHLAGPQLTTFGLLDAAANFGILRLVANMLRRRGDQVSAS